mmetsp:Transcript_5138/g.11414  ORF Transcript_5138/g.11414 Transcript_5138/m.11414 type:complete len:254 (-) Transcript_5138:589-1350(-)
MGMDEWVATYIDNPKDEQTSLEIPLLVFDVGELLLPGQKRYLHLYEARFIQVLQDSLDHHQNTFGFAFSVQSAGELLRVTTVVEIDEYQKLEVGVGVTVRGVGRALITKVMQADPYVKAQVSIYEDQEVVAPSIGNEIEGGSAASEAAAAAAEKLFALHEAMQEQEEKAQISSRVSKEISLDPRAMLAVRGRLPGPTGHARGRRGGAARVRRGVREPNDARAGGEFRRELNPCTRGVVWCGVVRGGGPGLGPD